MHACKRSISYCLRLFARKSLGMRRGRGEKENVMHNTLRRAGHAYLFSDMEERMHDCGWGVLGFDLHNGHLTTCALYPRFMKVR